MASKNLMKECWLSFWRGATSPALPALLVALSIIVAASAAICVFMTQEVIARSGYRYFMAGDLDTHTSVTHKVLSFQPSDSPVVVILGTSVTIRCVLREDRLAALIEAQSGKTPLVYNMATDAQTSWEMAALADHFYPARKGVLVVPVNPALLSYEIDSGDPSSLARIIETPRLGFVSSALDEEARIAGVKVPFRTGIYSLDNMHYLLARRFVVISNLINGGRDYGDPLTAPWMKRVNNSTFWQKEIENFSGLIKRYEHNHLNNLAVLSRFISHFKTSGKFSVILMESPINPRWHDTLLGAKFFPRFRKDLQKFAAQHGLPFVPISDKARLQATDFVDYEGHIGTASGRERCTTVLAASIAKELR